MQLRLALTSKQQNIQPNSALECTQVFVLMLKTGFLTKPYGSGKVTESLDRVKSEKESKRDKETFMNNLTALIGTAMAAALLSFPATVYANDREEVAMLEQSTISLTEAVELAERHVGGRAFAAEVDDDSFVPRFEVSVVKDDKIFDVQVDGEKGTVLGAREDLD